MNGRKTLRSDASLVCRAYSRHNLGGYTNIYR